MHDVKRQRDIRLIGDREPLQPAGRDVLGDHVARHVAPAEAGEQEIEAGGEVREPPDVTADDSAGKILGKRRAVGQNQLNVRLERFAGERLGPGRQRMAGRDHGPQSHRVMNSLTRSQGPAGVIG